MRLQYLISILITVFINPSVGTASDYAKNTIPQGEREKLENIERLTLDDDRDFNFGLQDKPVIVFPTTILPKQYSDRIRLENQWNQYYRMGGVYASKVSPGSWVWLARKKMEIDPTQWVVFHENGTLESFVPLDNPRLVFDGVGFQLTKGERIYLHPSGTIKKAVIKDVRARLPELEKFSFGQSNQLRRKNGFIRFTQEGELSGLFLHGDTSLYFKVGIGKVPNVEVGLRARFWPNKRLQYVSSDSDHIAPFFYYSREIGVRGTSLYSYGRHGLLWALGFERDGDITIVDQSNTSYDRFLLANGESVNLPKGNIRELSSNGTVRTFSPTHPVKLMAQGKKFLVSSHFGTCRTFIRLFNSGDLQRGCLPEQVRLTVNHQEVVFPKGSQIEFHENGEIKRAKLPEGTEVRFEVQGKDVIVDSTWFETYKNGNIRWVEEAHSRPVEYVTIFNQSYEAEPFEELLFNEHGFLVSNGVDRD